ncbi:MAG: hypothetical protein ACTHQQ_16510 [Solirubrobacteraceae bacterium]
METEAGRRPGRLRRQSIGALRQIIARRSLRADARGGILAIPRPRIGVLWVAMAVLVVLYVFHQGVGLGGPGTNSFFDRWLNDGLLWVSAFACLGGALGQTRGRVAWLLVSVALASWAIGDTVFTVRFGNAASIPATSISDVFWLAWYPLVVAALVLLVRDRVPGFELHRFIDGIAVILLVATPWVALFLQPVVEDSNGSSLAQALDFIYPLGDAVLFGATVGVFALMAWRPSRMWVALGLALLVMGLADAFYSVDATGHAHDHGIYDVAWVAGAALVAFAAWEPHPGQLAPRKTTGWAAIALPLAIGALAVLIQLYAFFHEIPRIERILTVIVLLIGMFQIVLTRPRPESDEASDQDLVSPANGRDPP